MFLARTITRAKWEPKQGMQEGEISADAVTGDLRTRDNSLSFWTCGGKDDANEVALAIAAGRVKVEKVEVVWLDDADLRKDGHKIERTDGDTPVEDLAKRHVDVRQLDYERLGKVAHRIVSAIEADQYSRFTRTRVKTLLAAAVSCGRVKLENLHENVRSEVQEKISGIN